MTSAMRHLFDNWHEVEGRLQTAPLIALFLDFDGTLADLRPTPDLVSLDVAARLVLSALVYSPRFRTWIISGRRLADLRARVCVPGIRYLGLYGWERQANSQLREQTREAFASLSACVGAVLAETRGVWIEQKQHALTVHYRGVTDAESMRARRMLEDVVARFEDYFRIEAGKNVWEVVPWELGDKGSAVTEELAAMPDGVLAVYLGDDQSDEAAFAALPDGITVRVGASNASHARYRVDGVAQVRAFLYRLTAEFA